MAPEAPGNLVVIDLRFQKGKLKGTVERVEYPARKALQIEETGGWFYVLWNETPKGERVIPVGGDVVYIADLPRGYEIKPKCPITLDSLGNDEYAYRDAAVGAGLMFVLILPKGYTLADPRPMPRSAKVFKKKRLAVYWKPQETYGADIKITWTIRTFEGDLKSESDRINADIDKSENVPDNAGVKVDESEVDESKVDFVVVTALEEERDALLAKLPNARKLPPSKRDVRVYFAAELPATFSDGTKCKYSLIIVQLLHMGRLEAAHATHDAIRQWRPGIVLLVGIAGGIAEAETGLGDVLVSDQIVDYELQKITPTGPEVRYTVHRADPSLLSAAQNYRSDDWQKLIGTKRPGEGVPQRRVGPIATGDKVVAFDEVLQKYRTAWPKLIGVEMEAGGVASACFQAKEAPGFFMVRSVSDLADQSKDTPFVKQWRAYACDVAASYVIGLIRSGPILPHSRARV